MSRRRIVLIAIIVTCIGIILTGLLGIWREPPKIKPRRIAEKTKPPGKKTGLSVPEFIIKNLSHPEYDKDGNKIYQLTSEEAREIGGTRLEIKQPVIEIVDVKSRRGAEPHTMIIRAKKGKWDKTSKDAKLDQEVVIEIDEHNQIRTESLSWVPSQRKITTDKPLEFKGEQLSISGVGLIADMGTEEARIKDKVRVEIHSTGGFTLFGKEEKASAEKKDGEPIVITCKGELLFERLPRRATFFDGVHVVKGTSSLDADKLEVVFTESGDSAERVTAIGNVKFEDEQASGSADKMLWRAEEDTVELTSATEAKIRQGRNELTAQRIILSHKEESMSALGAGKITAFSKMALSKDKGPSKERKITVTWKRDMMYSGNEAIFRGNVKLVQEGGMELTADRLCAQFDDSRSKIQHVQAKGNVVLKDGRRLANGKIMEWDVESGAGMLEGDPNAQVRDGDNLIVAQKLRFVEPSQHLIVEGPGYLVAERKGKDGAPSETFNVSWKQKMTYESKAHQATFLKDVEAERPGQKIRAQMLYVLFDDANKNLLKIVAKRDVIVEEEKRMGTGSELVYDARTKEILLSGGKEPARFTEEGQREIAAKKIYVQQDTEEIRTEGGGHLVFVAREGEGKDARTQKVDITWQGDMQFFSAKHRALFKERVIARHGDRNLKADQIEAFFNDNNRELKRVVAAGNVELKEQGRVGKGDKFVWDAAKEFVVLAGDPFATVTGKQGFMLKANRIQQFQKRDEVRAVGRGVLDFSGGPRTDDSKIKVNAGVRQIKIHWAKQMIFPRQQRKATFIGNVKVESSTRVLESERLEIFLDENEDLKEIRAYDDIFVYDTTQAKDGTRQEGTGQRLVWTADNDVALLTGDPVARLYYRGKPQSSGAWRFEGFFSDDEDKKKVEGTGGVAFTVPAR